MQFKQTNRQFSSVHLYALSDW